ncbi:hypothetical protein A1355_05420 [Methylomonas koyamae]|uniref:Uncharacterized protein n=1 Tax=Methylomonas koyamae TaxID=702114 RepID=A0A177NLC6_9GAMM|nr:hypothetical protein A1355_05420 [Methylomonas koyamae]
MIRTAEPKPIASRLHDYLEIARLYGYCVKVAPRNGRVLEGNGVDTVTIADKREVLLLDTDGIEALTLAKLEMPTPGATFTDQAFLNNLIGGLSRGPRCVCKCRGKNLYDLNLERLRGLAWRRGGAITPPQRYRPFSARSRNSPNRTV